MKLVDFIQPTAVTATLEAKDKPGALAALGRLLATTEPELGAARCTEILTEREQLATTGVGDAVALPHGKTDRIERICGAVGLARDGIDFDAVDGQPVRIFVALLAPQQSTSDHLKALARVAHLLKEPTCRARLLAADDDEALFAALIDEDGKH